MVGQVQQQTQMAGDAESTRMREAVAVSHHEVRGPLELLESARQKRHLTEGEEAGDIRKGERLLDDLLLDESQVRVGEEDDGAPSGGRPATGTVIQKRDVGRPPRSGYVGARPLRSPGAPSAPGWLPPRRASLARRGDRVAAQRQYRGIKRRVGR